MGTREWGDKGGEGVSVAFCGTESARGGVSAQCWVGGPQETNTSHLSVFRRDELRGWAEGSLGARGRAAFCRSGPQWYHLQEALLPAPPRKQTEPVAPCPPSPHPQTPGPLSPTSPHWLVFCGGEGAAVSCSPGALLFLPASQPSECCPAHPHPSPPQLPSGEPPTPGHTLSSSQNPFSSVAGREASAPGAQERLRHSLHEARQAGEAAPALWGLHLPGPQSGTPSRATQESPSAHSWVWPSQHTA